MKNTLIFTIVFLILNSCTDDPPIKPRTFRDMGYIYSSIDSLPFRNTQFKVFNNGTVTKGDDDKARLFMTDSNGYFDVVTYFPGGIYWPSYFEGSGYNGPGVIYSSGNTTNTELNQWVSIYKAYTRPYH